VFYRIRDLAESRGIPIDLILSLFSSFSSSILSLSLSLSLLSLSLSLSFSFSDLFIEQRYSNRKNRDVPFSTKHYKKKEEKKKKKKVVFRELAIFVQFC